MRCGTCKRWQVFQRTPVRLRRRQRRRQTRTRGYACVAAPRTRSSARQVSPLAAGGSTQASRCTPPLGRRNIVIIVREKHYKSMIHAKDFARAVVRDDGHAAVGEYESCGGGCADVAPGTPALCVAANFAHLHTVVVLLKAGASPNVTYDPPFGPRSTLPRSIEALRALPSCKRF